VRRRFVLCLLGAGISEIPWRSAFPLIRFAAGFALGLMPARTSLAAEPPARGPPPPSKTVRIGILSSAKRPAEADLMRSLAAIGYVDGRGTVIMSRDGEGSEEKLQAYAGELVRLPVDVIVVAGGPAALAARAATHTIPIVAWGVGDPVGAGLVTNVRHPDGNITGVTELSTELTGKRLEILKEAVPSIMRVALLWNATDTAMNLRHTEAERAAPRLGLKILPFPVTEVSDFDKAFAAMESDRPDAIMVVTDPLTRMRDRAIIDFISSHRLPSLFEFGEYVKRGGFISYGPSVAEMTPRVAYFVDRLLKGARPADLPDALFPIGQPDHRKGPWPRPPTHAARPRRRGDRIERNLLRCMSLDLALFGSGPTDRRCPFTGCGFNWSVQHRL
jgi:putative ABC transport system substrate-binding protein